MADTDQQTRRSSPHSTYFNKPQWLVAPGDVGCTRRGTQTVHAVSAFLGLLTKTTSGAGLSEGGIPSPGHVLLPS